MTKTLWIVLGVSAFVVLGFVLAMRSLLRENRQIDASIDLDNLPPPNVDEDEENEDDGKGGW